MQIHDHLALGKALAEAYFADRGALCRLAFVLGNIAPDLTATTHLRGHLHDRNTWGHSYANALPVIRRLSRALERHADGGLHDCYRLGVLLHYTADAFTWPHNEHFGGSLREHMRYERRLHKEIAARLSREKLPRRAALCQHGSRARALRGPRRPRGDRRGLHTRANGAVGRRLRALLVAPRRRRAGAAAAALLGRPELTPFRAPPTHRRAEAARGPRRSCPSGQASVSRRDAGRFLFAQSAPAGLCSRAKAAAALLLQNAPSPPPSPRRAARRGDLT